jgi:hypothetical protein
MRLFTNLIRKGIETDLVELTQVPPNFVGLGSRCGVIGRFRQIWFFHKKGYKNEMQHETQCKGGEQCGMKCNMI